MPPFSAPTDNIYKFVCLFGLALIVSALFSFVATHTSSLDRKIRFVEVIIPLEAKQPRSKVEEELLGLNKRLLDVTKSNERFAHGVIGTVAAIGLMLAIHGWVQWRRLVQTRDDRLAALQIEKLQFEVAALRAQHAARPDERLLDDVDDEA